MVVPFHFAELCVANKINIKSRLLENVFFSCLLFTFVSLESFQRTELCFSCGDVVHLPSEAKCKSRESSVIYLKTKSYPLHTLLEQAGDMSFSQCVHKLSGSVMGRDQLDAIYETVEFLFEQAKMSVMVRFWRLRCCGGMLITSHGI